MADIGQSCSSPMKSTNDKPLLVRVKRKAFQSRLEAFWLEINERPLKKPLLDFEKLSISDTSEKGKLKTKKVLVRHVETVHNSEATFDILQSFVPNSTEAFERKTKSKELRHPLKKESKHDRLLVRARQEQEVLAKNARFEQIWRSRKGNKEAMHDKALHEACHLYDVVRVDVEETSSKVRRPEDSSLEDHMILHSYLPLLREFIPSAAEEIESDIRAYVSNQVSADDYVYDLYTVNNDMDATDEVALHPFPLVQVEEEDDFYDGPAESEFESDDSNAEDNPRNDYPDEDVVISEEEEAETGASDNESELESEDTSHGSPDPEDLVHHESSEDADLFYEEDDDGDDYDYDDVEGDGEDWR